MEKIDFRYLPRDLYIHTLLCYSGSTNVSFMTDLNAWLARASGARNFFEALYYAYLGCYKVCYYHSLFIEGGDIELGTAFIQIPVWLAPLVRQLLPTLFVPAGKEEEPLFAVTRARLREIYDKLLKDPQILGVVIFRALSGIGLNLGFFFTSWGYGGFYPIRFDKIQPRLLLPQEGFLLISRPPTDLHVTGGKVPAVAVLSSLDPSQFFIPPRFRGSVVSLADFQEFCGKFPNWVGDPDLNASDWGLTPAFLKGIYSPRWFWILMGFIVDRNSEFVIGSIADTCFSFKIFSISPLVPGSSKCIIRPSVAAFLATPYPVYFVTKRTEVKPPKFEPTVLQNMLNKYVIYTTGFITGEIMPLEEFLRNRLKLYQATLSRYSITNNEEFLRSEAPDSRKQTPNKPQPQPSPVIPVEEIVSTPNPIPPVVTVSEPQTPLPLSQIPATVPTVPVRTMEIDATEPLPQLSQLNISLIKKKMESSNVFKKKRIPEKSPQDYSRVSRKINKGEYTRILPKPTEEDREIAFEEEPPVNFQAGMDPNDASFVRPVDPTHPIVVASKRVAVATTPTTEGGQLLDRAIVKKEDVDSRPNPTFALNVEADEMAASIGRRIMKLMPAENVADIQMTLNRVFINAKTDPSVEAMLRNLWLLGDSDFPARVRYICYSQRRADAMAQRSAEANDARPVLDAIREGFDKMRFLSRNVIGMEYLMSYEDKQFLLSTYRSEAREKGTVKIEFNPDGTSLIVAYPTETRPILSKNLGVFNTTYKTILGAAVFYKEQDYQRLNSTNPTSPYLPEIRRKVDSLKAMMTGGNSELKGQMVSFVGLPYRIQINHPKSNSSALAFCFINAVGHDHLPKITDDPAKDDALKKPRLGTLFSTAVPKQGYTFQAEPIWGIMRNWFGPLAYLDENRSKNPAVYTQIFIPTPVAGKVTVSIQFPAQSVPFANHLDYKYYDIFEQLRKLKYMIDKQAITARSKLLKTMTDGPRAMLSALGRDATVFGLTT